MCELCQTLTKFVKTTVGNDGKMIKLEDNSHKPVNLSYL